MKKLLIVIILIFLVGLFNCTPTQVYGAYDVSRDPGKDGYFFQRKEINNNSFRILVVTHNSLQELRAAAAYAGINQTNVVAFSSRQQGGKLCIVHVIDPSVSYQPEFAGHELFHCVYGNFHPYMGG